MALLTISEAAAILRISIHTLYNALYREKIGLRTRRVGRLLRFDERDVQAVIERGREATAHGAGRLSEIPRRRAG